MKDMERFTEEAKMEAADAWNRFAEALADLGKTAEEQRPGTSTTLQGG